MHLNPSTHLAILLSTCHFVIGGFECRLLHIDSCKFSCWNNLQHHLPHNPPFVPATLQATFSASCPAPRYRTTLLEPSPQKHLMHPLLWSWCRSESGWCSDVTSTHGAWRHAGVRFLLSGVFQRAPAYLLRRLPLHFRIFALAKPSPSTSNPIRTRSETPPLQPEPEVRASVV